MKTGAFPVTGRPDENSIVKSESVCVIAGAFTMSEDDREDRGNLLRTSPEI